MARLVLVHGLNASATSWRSLPNWLRAKGHQVDAIDLPGHGANKNKTPQDLDAMAKWTLSHCPEGEKTVLIGHSLGGMVISQAAVMAPDRISRLVYLAAFTPTHGQSGHSLLGDDLTFETFSREFVNLGLRGTAKLFALLEAGAPQEHHYDPLEDPSDKIATIDRRAILCEDDGVIPFELQETMTEGLVTDIMDTGHFPMIEDMSALRDHISWSLEDL